MRNRLLQSIPGVFALGLAVTLAACSTEQQAGAPPEPAQPTPVVASGTSAPPSPKAFKAHFAWNKAKLSAGEAKAVQAAAAELHANPAATVRLIGKTDTSGSESYNMKLSQRRAETVYKALIAAGVPANRIERKAVGESQPDVATGNGVREPQNRVVDIFVGI